MAIYSFCFLLRALKPRIGAHITCYKNVKGTSYESHWI
jgi:hypothetical protein